MGAGESSVGTGALRQRGAEWVESRLLDAGVDRPARVVLIGDSELINEGLRVMLSHHGDQVEMIGVLPASAPLPPEGVAADVALVNIHSRDDRFQHLVESLVAADPPVRVVIFADDDDERRVFEALRLGVSGYLLESSAAAALADHLVRAGEGELVIDPRIATRIATRVARGDSPSWPGAEAGLSRREGEVLQLLLGGRSNRQDPSALDLQEDGRGQPSAGGCNRHQAGHVDGRLVHACRVGHRSSTGLDGRRRRSDR
jgi:DNA-binding NarL/FixJ family response regulator